MFFDDKCFIAALKKVANTLVSCIKILCIVPIYVAHGSREIAVGSFDEHMIVIAHETIGMENEIVDSNSVFEPIEKSFSIVIIKKDFLLGIAASNHMIKAAFEFDT